jgi:ATP-dependent RNA helicase DDX54/DBP10
VFGSLDQVARQRQLRSFRDGDSEILVVTDVAARGLDIPVMDNVINYDYPANPRLFIHRVGRTARAGQKGRAISLVTKDDLPYVCDLEAVVGLDVRSSEPPILGTLPRAQIDDASHSLKGLEQDEAQTLPALREVMRKGQGMYERSRSKATPNGYRNAKGIESGSAADRPDTIHPDFVVEMTPSDAQNQLIESLSKYRPAETVMELGNRGKSSTTQLMNDRRRLLQKRRVRAIARDEPDAGSEPSIKSVPQATLTENVSLKVECRCD